MSHKVFYIGIRWVSGPPRTRPVELALDPLGDWVRFNDATWFLSTELSSQELDQALQPALTRDDNLLVISLDPKDRFGWAPQWIWDWIDGQRQDPPKTAAAIVGARPSPERGGKEAASRVGKAAEE